MKEIIEHLEKARKDYSNLAARSDDVTLQYTEAQVFLAVRDALDTALDVAEAEAERASHVVGETWSMDDVLCVNPFLTDEQVYRVLSKWSEYSNSAGWFNWIATEIHLMARAWSDEDWFTFAYTAVAMLKETEPDSAAWIQRISVNHYAHTPTIARTMFRVVMRNGDVPNIGSLMVKKLKETP